MPWSRRFENPIPLPDGRTLRTLRDAASYLMALPGKTRQSDEWQAAIEALLMAAENRGPLMHARIGMLRALNRNVERTFNSSGRDTHWGKRKLKKDQRRWFGSIEWFKENDPEGVAFGYEVLGNEARPRSYCPICGALIDMRDLGQVLAHVHDAEIEVGEEPEPPVQAFRSQPARTLRA